MKRFLLLPLFLLIATFSFAQRNEQVKKLVNEGIELHDKGDYDAAIKKYNEALAIDPNDLGANYEKAYSCQMAKRYQECIDVCKFIIKKFPDAAMLNQVYEVYGNATDDAGNVDEAIRIFDEGIKKFPGYYMLHFNKGVTLMRQKKNAEALSCYNSSLQYNGLHPSSNYYTGVLLQDENRIPALLAYMTFVAVEPQSDRTKKAYDAIDEIVYRNVKKDGNNISINISPDLLDQTKNKKAENNFSSVEFLFSITGSLDNAKGMDSIVSDPAGKFDLKLQLLINSLEENKKGSKGFYWDHFVPFFAEMKKESHTLTLSNLIFQASGEEMSVKWLADNKAKVKAFYQWLEKYSWPKNK